MEESIKAGDRILYRCPKGWGSGRVVNVCEGKYQIETTAGKMIFRKAHNVKPAVVIPPHLEGSAQ